MVPGLGVQREDGKREKMKKTWTSKLVTSKVVSVRGGQGTEKKGKRQTSKLLSSFGHKQCHSH